MAQPSPLAARAHVLARLAQETFDVLVVGGGITGCGLARDAALRGLQVALVEKDDFASGTSSRSSRLVHGGLRYLEHGYLRLVFESSAEQRHLLRIAPHLVWPQAFVWPIYAGARVPRWKLEAGLWLYDALSLFRNVAVHHALSAAQVRDAEPGLRTRGLRGGARYFDAATNDARLTLANARDARRRGAVVANHVALRRFRFEAGRVVGADVVDQLGGDEFHVRARVCVNATGPWSDAVRRLDDATSPVAVHGSKGVHIELPAARLGNRGAVTLLSPLDGRVMFVLPAGRHTIVGTTDTYTTTGPDDVRASTDDVRYLLDSVNAFFPDAAQTSEDVISAWAGIRPLVSAGTTDPGSASREHAIVTSAHGVLSITGGKLTTYRVMAAEAASAVLRALGRRDGRGATARLPLPGGDTPSVDAMRRQALATTGDQPLADHLVRAHGSEWPLVWQDITADASGSARPIPDLPYTLGELRYAVREEMALSLADLFMRRTHLAFETRDHGVAAAPGVAAALAPLLDWSPQQVRAAADAYAAEAARIFGIDDATPRRA